MEVSTTGRSKPTPPWPEEIGNTAYYDADAVGGGRSNLAKGGRATISGGFKNTALGMESFIGGGIDNQAGGPRATVSGGYVNIAGGNAATIPGGANNLASGAYSFAAGARARATHTGSFVWGSGAEDTSSFGDNTFTVRAHGGAKLLTGSGTGTGVILALGETPGTTSPTRQPRKTSRTWTKGAYWKQ